MRANMVSLQEFQLMDCIETHGRGSGSPESESWQGRQLVVIHRWEGKLQTYPVPLRRNSNKTHLNLNWLPEIKLLGSNWQPGTLQLFRWPKKLLLVVRIGVGYKLSHNAVGKKVVENLKWSNAIQHREQDGQSVPWCLWGDHWLSRIQYGMLRRTCESVNLSFDCFLWQMYMMLQIWYMVIAAGADASCISWVFILHSSLYHRIHAHDSPSATTLVSVRNTKVFQSALTALTEPRTLWQRNTWFPSARRQVMLHTYLLYFAPGYAPSERHVCYTLRRCCSYAVAVYTMPGDVYAFFRPSAKFYLSTITTYRMPHSPHIC